MSSFSSVVRKGKVAPRVAPRRNVVRKAPTSRSEDPAHVGSGLSADSLPPTPPATAEDADTQASLSTRESATPQRQHDTPETVNEGFTVASKSRRTDDRRDDSVGSASIQTQPPAIPSVQDTSSTCEPQTTHDHQTTEVLREEDRPANNESDNLSQVALNETNEDNSRPHQTTTSRNVSSGVLQAAQSVSEHASSIEQDPTPQAQPRASRKRKQPPRASAFIILSQPSVSTPPTSPPTSTVTTTPSQAPRRAPSRTASVVSQQSTPQTPAPENEFDRISSRLQIVQDASAAINAHTLLASRSSRSTSVNATNATLTMVEEPTEQPNAPRPTKRRKTDRTQKRTAEERAADVVARAVRSTRNSTDPAQKRPRGATPEDAEMHEITPETTKMGELCDDHKRGKKSETEKEMAANWDEILRRRKEDAEERMALAAAGSRRRREKGQNTDANTEQVAAVVPHMDIENGQIVVTSRQIDRAAETAANAEHINEADIREDKDIYKRVLATTVGCRNPQTQGQVWDDLATELFFTGLKKFGTDFQMISATIPGKTRKQVKLKYNVEERKNWHRVKKCLSMKEEVNLDEYAQATGVEFASVADVYKQMEEDEKRLREEDEQRRRDEGIISQDQTGDTGANADAGSGEADVAIPSIETEAEAAAREVVEAAVGGADRQSTVSRVGSTTTARQTAQPSGKRKQTGKKNTAASKKGRQAAAKNKGFEGVEERIGGIEEVARPGA